MPEFQKTSPFGRCHKLQISLKVKNEQDQELSYSINGSTASPEKVDMLLIPMLMLSYTQNETIFQSMIPKDPTMQIFSS